MSLTSDGTLAGTPSAPGNYNFGITATDVLFGAGPEEPISIQIDLTAPAAPTLTATDPASPANNVTPQVAGTAEAGSTITLYATTDCTGTPLATGTAAQLATGIEVTVSANMTTSISATSTDAATNVSACSAPLVYVEDSIAPAAPTLSTTDPASPSMVTTVAVKGSAEIGSTVRVYATADCSGTPLATGTAAQLVAGITVVVAAGTTSQLRATTTDAAGNLSTCSAPLAFVHHSGAPAAPQLTSTSPASPSSQRAPVVRGSAEAGSTVALFATADCSGSPLATGSADQLAAGIAVQLTDVGVYEIRATTTDATGNRSSCSEPISYRVALGCDPGTLALVSIQQAAPLRLLLEGTAPHTQIGHAVQVQVRVGRGRITNIASATVRDDGTWSARRQYRRTFFQSMLAQARAEGMKRLPVVRYRAVIRGTDAAATTRGAWVARTDRGSIRTNRRRGSNRQVVVAFRTGTSRRAMVSRTSSCSQSPTRLRSIPVTRRGIATALLPRPRSGAYVYRITRNHAVVSIVVRA